MAIYIFFEPKGNLMSHVGKCDIDNSARNMGGC